MGERSPIWVKSSYLSPSRQVEHVLYGSTAQQNPSLVRHGQRKRLPAPDVGRGPDNTDRDVQRSLTESG